MINFGTWQGNSMSIFDAGSEHPFNLGDDNFEDASCGRSYELQSESIPRQSGAQALASIPSRGIEVSNTTSATKRASGIEARYSIFSGKALFNNNPESEKKQLRIGNTIYDTLVTGVSAIRDREDFRGIIKLKYNLESEKFYMVFALWYSISDRSYYLTSLGQYSDRSYQNDLKRYSRNGSSKKNLHITLSPIYKQGLVNLEQKLFEANITRASVCLMRETISARESFD